MEAQANTTREQSNKKNMQVGDPRMAEMEEQEKKFHLMENHFVIEINLTYERKFSREITRVIHSTKSR